MKKNLVKLMACVLATVSLGSLVSCGEEVEAVDTVEINVWATAAEEAVITKVVNEWNADHPAEEQFKIKFTALSEGDCGTTLAKDPTVEGAPALFLCADDHLASLTSQNIIAELKGERKERVLENTSDIAIQGVTTGSGDNMQLWGYPITSDNGYFLWYDKSALPESKTGSLEDILAHAKANKKQVLFELNNGWYANSFIMSPEACGTNSLYWSRTDGKVSYTTTWDNEVAVKVSEYVESLLVPYVNDGTLLVAGDDALVAGFKNKEIIAAVRGTWVEKDLKEAVGDNLAATKLPAYHIDGKAYQMASFGGSKVYCINKTRPVAEQITAATLAELLCTKNSQLIRFEERATVPCNLDALKDKRYTENVSIGAAALDQQNAYACVQAKTAEGRYWDIGKVIGTAYTDGNKGGETWAQYLKGLCDTLRKAQ